MSAIFRQKALAKLRSPEQLDEPLKVIMRRTRLGWWTLAVTIALGLTWAWLGTLPETGRGQGILMTPNTVVPVQARAGGQVGVWHVNVGDRVEAGQVIGTLEQPDLQRQLDEAVAKLKDVQSRNEVLQKMRNRFNQEEREALLRKRRELSERADYLRQYVDEMGGVVEEVNERNTAVLNQQQEQMEETRLARERLTEELLERYQSYQRLRERNLASVDAVRQRQQAYEDSRLQLRNLDVDAQELELQRVQNNETYLNARNLITQKQYRLTQLELEIQELDNQILNKEKAAREADFRDRNEVADLDRRIDRFRKQLERDRSIVSDQAGRVLELTANEGSIVNQGQRLAQIDTRTDDQPLVALAYFQDKIGKQIDKGEFIRVSPSTVSQKLYGSIKAKVVKVSEFPVTQEAVVNYVGNSEVASKLTTGGFEIEVIAELYTDPTTPSGFEWTSATGPDTTITAGTTSDVWVTFEQRSPISYVLPKIREWTGI
ncbi:MAG: NHLP bacteriocin system secretion protein [Gammaproteobacteria bacterium]|nr:NHLP bacteriocin system secretion protein [Gammaproteobacteria bacterium]